MAPNNTMAIFTAVVPATISNIIFSFTCLINGHFTHIYSYLKICISYLDAM